MPTSPERPPSELEAQDPARQLQQRVERLGITLSDSLSAVLAQLPRPAAGPQVLANTLEISVVTASRLLKAIGHDDPVAILQSLPGPNPLRSVVEAAQAVGVPRKECDHARRAIEAFDQLIRTEAGDRGALKAMLSAWLPAERREFETQRRQSIYKALCELEGVSCDLALNCIMLHPSDEAGRVDIVNIQGMLGIDRIRGDAVVQLGSRHLGGPDQPRPRFPSNLAGQPAFDGLHTVRLDEFCQAPPAPMETERHESHILYTLGVTGFGPSSRVDLVIGEVNRGELENRATRRDRAPYFFFIPEIASRRLVFDLIVHREVYSGLDPTLLAYETAGRGPTAAGVERRKSDLRHICETTEKLPVGVQRRRLLEFPRYGELLDHAFRSLEWNAEEFRSYRIEITYPLRSIQVTFAFFPESE